jgi:tetratricopeptide (TPR) repeat protein
MYRHAQNAIDAGDGDTRLAALRRRVAANPDDLAARMELAKAYTAAGYPDLAIEHYRVALLRFPESAELVIQLARNLRSLNMPLEARMTLEQFVARQPAASGEVLGWLGILQDEAREYTAGEASYRAAIERQPSSDWLHNNLGYNLLLQGRNQEAAAEFRQALTINSSSALARNNLGLAVAADPKDALLHWESVSDPATAHNNLAAVLIEKGSYAEARKELEVALRYKPDHQAALSNLHLVSELDGGAVVMHLPAAGITFWRRFLQVLIGDSTPKASGGPATAASQ